jgi:hypothetical protein
MIRKTKRVLLILLGIVFSVSVYTQPLETDATTKPSQAVEADAELSAEQQAEIEKTKQAKEAEQLEQERKKKAQEELARKKLEQNKVGEKSKDFIPTEEISEDKPVPFPVDI